MHWLHIHTSLCVMQYTGHTHSVLTAIFPGVPGLAEFFRESFKK